MKKLLAVLLLIPAMAVGEPYLKLLDIRHPMLNMGSLVDPWGSSDIPAASIPIVVTRKGGWVPLAIGGGHIGKDSYLFLGPSANVLPVFQTLARGILDVLTPADKYQNLKTLLTPASDSNGDVSFCVSPSVVKQFDSWETLTHGRVIFRLFIGAVWSF